MRHGWSCTAIDRVCVSCVALLTVLAACDGVESSSSAVDAPVRAAASSTPARAAPPGMVWIPAGEFLMGGNDPLARADELPRHKVRVDAFWMDETEVTNAQYEAFVVATGFVTTAEKKPDWAELQQQLPPGTPKPDESIFVPGSLVFTPPDHPVRLDDVSGWWSWMPGASWKHPAGPSSSIAGRDDDAVVQVSWDDAVAYAAWAGKRLPTEAQWEWAARGGLVDRVHPWGDEPIDAGAPKANAWQGHFPDQNTLRDGFYGVAPVRSFAPNGYGLFDMAGNVWEWCTDWYRADYYAQVNRPGAIENPPGPTESFDPQEPHTPKRVHRGGSFLCHEVYCASYRVSARMKSSPDSGLGHCGFRCVKSGAER